MLLAPDYHRVRRLTRALLEGLGAEDCLVQAMPDVSPPKWHLAHTSWFFEVFVLEPGVPGYRPLNPAYRELFNSYYVGVGARPPRGERGCWSRPTLEEVFAYRDHVDRAMARAFESGVGAGSALVELGLHHEQQHQELLVMDVKYNFSVSPLLPAYRRGPLPRCPEPPPLDFVEFGGGLERFGAGDEGFAFDNERPVHRRWLEPFGLATRLITNAEMLEFIEAGGYRTPSLWLSDGWAWRTAHGAEAPLYWRRAGDGGWLEFTLHGEVPLELHAPVCHVSAYEAEAFATWAGARLPTEFEWELAARRSGVDFGACLEDGLGHPGGVCGPGVTQLYGAAWQWTRSAYEPYPGFAPASGAIGEYNGKFMSNQWVLRGSSFATPRGHARPSYRNYFYPHQRWPFTGIRLARRAS